MSSYIYPISKLFKDPNTSIGKLVHQASDISKLNDLFKQTFDPEISEHCQVSCYLKGILILHVDSASWATKLRYQVPMLLTTLRQFEAWAGLCSIQIKIKTQLNHPTFTTKTEASITPLSLPMSATEQIATLIETLKNQSDSKELISSLERLMEHGKKNSK